MKRGIILLSVLAMACSCSPGEAGAAGGADADFAPGLAAAARSYREYIRVNRVPFASSAIAGAVVNVWASPAAYPTYAALDPAAPGSCASLRPGDTLVREILSDAGETEKLTVIIRGPEGYDPPSGDLFFAVTSPSGEVLEVDGRPQQGRIAECAGCHAGRASAGFLFGVPHWAR